MTVGLKFRTEDRSPLLRLELHVGDVHLRSSGFRGCGRRRRPSLRTAPFRCRRPSVRLVAAGSKTLPNPPIIFFFIQVKLDGQIAVPVRTAAA